MLWLTVGLELNSNVPGQEIMTWSIDPDAPLWQWLPSGTRQGLPSDTL